MSEIAKNFLKEMCWDKVVLEILTVKFWYRGIIKSYDNEYILIEGRGLKDSGGNILLQQRYIESISIYKEGTSTTPR